MNKNKINNEEKGYVAKKAEKRLQDFLQGFQRDSLIEHIIDSYAPS